MNTLSPHADNGNPLEKRCTGPCGRILPNTLKFFHSNGKYGLYPKCKECKGKEAKERYSRPEVKEHVLAREKARRRTPGFREHRRAYDQTYYSQPEKREQRNTTVRNYKRVYYTVPENKARRDATDTIYRNRPEVRAHNQKLDCVRQHNRRARIKGNGGSHTVQDIQEQLKRQKHKCYYCSAKFKKKNNNYIYHIDHVIPVIKGGSNDISNIVLACPTCNQTKNDRLLHEWPEGGRLL